jgi:hypothetical protein
MKASSVVISLFAVLFVGPARGQSSDELLKKTVLSKYPEAFKAWEARYSTAQGTVIYKIEHTTRKDEPSEALYSFKCKLPDMAVLSTVVHAPGAPEQQVFGWNRSYSFSLVKAAPGADFSIRSLLEATSEAGRPPKGSPARAILTPILQFPYRIPFSPMPAVSRPRFVLRAVSPLRRGGKNLLKVEYDYPNDPTRNVPKNARDPGGTEGFFVVSPEEKWVVYEYESREKKGVSRNVHKGTVQYEGTSDGFPIPKRVASQTIKLPGGEVVASGSYEFLEFRFGDVPDTEFTLSAFGLPEEVSRPSKVARTNGPGYWFLALALVAAATAVLFKIASSRVKRASTPSPGTRT